MLVWVTAAVARAGHMKTAPMDAHAAAASEYRPQGAMHFDVAPGDLFVPVIGDGIHAPVNRTNSTRAPTSRRRRKLALLNAQWRGGSTVLTLNM